MTEADKAAADKAAADKAAANKKKDGKVTMYKPGDRSIEINDTKDNIAAMKLDGWSLTPVEK